MLQNILKRLLKLLVKPTVGGARKTKVEPLKDLKPLTKNQRDIAMDVIAENARALQDSQKKGILAKLGAGLVAFANS
jgi:endo-alpha-1,4-polygalactosaminidase (GH114 family)